MASTVEERIAAAIVRAYAVFARYERPSKLTLCGFCYHPADIELYQLTPLRDLSPDQTRVLLWETADHWDDVDTYKHFLPRLLEGLAPPLAIDDLYPAHVFETLGYHAFSAWPEPERAAVAEFFHALEPWLEETRFTFDEKWIDARDKLLGAMASR